MNSFIYLFIVINVLLVESSSIRNANHEKEFSNSKSVFAKEKDNGIKIVSGEPFIMQLATRQENEKYRNDEEKERKEKSKKKLLKKRYHNSKVLRKKQRTKREANFIGKKRRETNNAAMRKENQRKVFIDPKRIHKPFWEAHNMNLTTKSKQHEIDHSKESTSAEGRTNKLYGEKMRFKPSVKPKNIQRLSHYIPTSTSEIPLSALVYPPTANSDKSSKYTGKGLKQDAERVEEKINYLKRMLRMNDSDSLTEINRRTRKIETDRAANKIAKMFLALSALNYGKHKSPLKSEDNTSWESEEKEQDDNSIKSFNEERYKIKKWIEHMKSKRSSKTCTCNDEGSAEHDLFPLEKTLTIDNSEDSIEECKRKIAGTKSSPLKKKIGRPENQKYRSDNNLDNKIKALTTRGRRKLELPLEDLEIYRSRAKQILQNAEEILDKLNKQEEEKRYSNNPALLMDHVKELTSRIHADPRNSENDLIKMIQKNMDWLPLYRFRDEGEKKDFSKSVKSYFVDPYEKARALTEESARKLSAYLLKNLAMLGSDDKKKEEEEFKAVGKKEKIPQIHQSEDSWSKDILSTGDLKCEKYDDGLNKEKGLSQPKFDQPTTSTASQDDLDEKFFKDSKEIVSLGGGLFQKKIKEILKEQHIHPKEVTEDTEKLKDVETLAAENPEDLKVAMDWKSSNLEDVKSEIPKEDNVRVSEEYVESDTNIKYVDKNYSEKQDVPLEKKNEDQLHRSSEYNEKLFDLLQEGKDGKNMLEKNKELMSKDFTEAEPNVTTMEKQILLGDPEPNVANDKKKIEAEEKSEVAEKNGLLVMDQEQDLDDKNLMGKTSVLDDEMSQTKFSEINKEQLKNVEESNEIQILQEKDPLGEEPKIENLLAAIEDEKEKEAEKLDKNHENFNNLKMNHELDNQKEVEGEEENRKEESLDTLSMNGLDERNEDTVLAEIDKVTEVNSEIIADMVSVQQNNEEFSSEKQTDQKDFSQEKLKNDKFQESQEDLLKKQYKEEKKDLKDMYLSKDEKEVMEKDDVSQETISEELNRNENDVIASEHLKSREEEKTKQQDHKQQSDSTSREKDVQGSNLGKHEKETFATKEETEDLVSDYKEKDASSVQDSKENESKSVEEPGSNKEIVELSGISEENVEAMEDNKISSVANQGYDSFDQENIPSEYKISQDFQLASKNPGSGNTETEEKKLGSQEERTDITEPKEELLGSQEGGTDITEPKEELLGSQERGTDITEPKEELLGSQEGGTDITEPKEELLGSQEGGTDITEPKEELLRSQEGGTGNTGSKELLQEANTFRTLQPDDFRKRESIQEEKDWLTENGFRSIESNDHEDRETSHERKDWLIKSGQSKTEDFVQSENQKKGTNNNESVEGEQMVIGNEKEDIPISKKLEEEMQEQENKIVELTKPEEKFKETLSENKSGEKEEILKGKQSEEIEDNQSSNVEEGDANERINDDDIMTAPKIKDYDDKKEKLLRKIDQEEKEIVMDKDDLMKQIIKIKDLEWAAHPFEDETLNDFKDALTAEGSPLEYYDKEESQTSQFLKKGLEYAASSEEEKLQEINSTPTTKNLKIPQEIEKIMKDLNDGKEKDDIQSIQSLDPEKIDKFIDKIDEAKKEKEEEDVDCKKECACADRIELRSRRTGRYEIAKDFLRWLKDMKLNRVLSDD